MRKTMVASAPTLLVFQARNAHKFAAMVTGTRRGCVVAASSGDGNGGLLDGTWRDMSR